MGMTLPFHRLAVVRAARWQDTLRPMQLQRPAIIEWSCYRLGNISRLIVRGVSDIIAANYCDIENFVDMPQVLDKGAFFLFFRSLLRVWVRDINLDRWVIMSLSIFAQNARRIHSSFELDEKLASALAWDALCTRANIHIASQLRPQRDYLFDPGKIFISIGRYTLPGAPEVSRAEQSRASGISKRRASYRKFHKPAVEYYDITTDVEAWPQPQSTTATGLWPWRASG